MLIEEWRIEFGKISYENLAKADRKRNRKELT